MFRVAFAVVPLAAATTCTSDCGPAFDDRIVVDRADATPPEVWMDLPLSARYRYDSGNLVQNPILPNSTFHATVPGDVWMFSLEAWGRDDESGLSLLKHTIELEFDCGAEVNGRWEQWPDAHVYVEVERFEVGSDEQARPRRFLANGFTATELFDDACRESGPASPLSRRALLGIEGTWLVEAENNAEPPLVGGVGGLFTMDDVDVD